MGGYLNNTGKIFFGSLAAWVGAKLFQKFQESDRVQSLDEMDLPDNFRNAIVDAAFEGDKRRFVRILDEFQVPHDPYVRRRFWELAGGE